MNRVTRSTYQTHEQGSWIPTGLITCFFYKKIIYLYNNKNKKSQDQAPIQYQNVILEDNNFIENEYFFL